MEEMLINSLSLLAICKIDFLRGLTNNFPWVNSIIKIDSSLILSCGSEHSIIYQRI
jgi:hypothetical protein